MITTHITKEEKQADIKAHRSIKHEIKQHLALKPHMRNYNESIYTKLTNEWQETLDSLIEWRDSITAKYTK